MLNLLTRLGRLRAESTVLALLLGSSCADLLDVPEHPRLVSTDPWLCTSSPLGPANPQVDSVHVRVRLCDFVSTNCSQRVTGVTADVCNKRDYECTTPVQSGIYDINGDLALDVPSNGLLGTGFDGYLRVIPPFEFCTNRSAFGDTAGCKRALQLVPGCDPSTPDDRCKAPTFIPGLLFFNPPLIADVIDPIVLPMFSSLAADNLARAGVVQIDDNSLLDLGNVFATALDCEGRPAAGVTFGLSPNPPMLGSVYQQDGVINPRAVATDASGFAGLIGVAPGFVRVSGYAGDVVAGREVSSVGAQVVPGTVTYVTLAPWTK